MVDQMIRPTYIPNPTLKPLTSTILDVAEVHEGIEWLGTSSGVLTDGQQESYSCLDVRFTDICPLPRAAKVLTDKPVWGTGGRFNVYAGLTCKPFGYDVEESASKVKDVFLSREAVGVERGIMAMMASMGATDITPAAGAVTAVQAIGLLEGHAGRYYAGLPTIHAARSTASIAGAGGGADMQAGVFYSPLGTPIVAGAGYDYPSLGPTGAVAATGEVWMYATGSVVVARGAVFAEPQLDRSTNEIVALAERPYVAYIDCYAAAIRVKVVS